MSRYKRQAYFKTVDDVSVCMGKYMYVWVCECVWGCVCVCAGEEWVVQKRDMLPRIYV